MSDSNKIACVTGASGMIGSRIVRQLIQNGYKVRALSRKQNYYVPGVEHYHGGIDDASVLEKFVSGADAVFHCAAELYDENLMLNVNYEGTKNLVSASNKSGIGYFCFLSSASVVGKTNQQHVDEQTPCNPQTVYEKTKWKAEKYIADNLKCNQIVILRPMYVVDKSRPGILDNIINKSFLEWIIVFFKGGERAHIVHARDVAKAAVHFISKSFVSPAYYIVSCDHDEYNTFGWISKIIAAYKSGRSVEKIRHPSIHIPLFLLNILIKLINKSNKHLFGKYYSSGKLISSGFSFGSNVNNIVHDVVQYQSSFPPKESILNRLLSGSLWASTGKIITIFFGFLCNIFLARLLDPESMGAYFLILSIVLFSAIFAQLGTNISAVRFIAESLGTNRPARAVKAVYISFKIAVTGIILISFLFLSGGGHWLAVRAFNSKLMAGVIGIFTVWIAFTALQHLLSEIFRGFSRIDLSSIFGGMLTNILSFIFFVLIWLVYGNSNLHQIIVVSVISCGAGTICAFLFLFDIIKKIKGESSLDGKELFFISIPLLFTNLILFIISQIDIWIIGIFRHKEEVAIYGAASKLALLISVPILIANSVVPPIIAELYAKGEKEKLEHTLRSTATFASIPSFVFLVIYIVFGNNILGFAFGEIYREGLISLIVLSFGQFFYVCSGSPGIVLMMTGFQKQIMVITIICLMVCLFGSVIMIEYFGINGVAIATAGGLSLQAILLTFFVKKKIDILTPVQFTNLKL